MNVVGLTFSLQMFFYENIVDEKNLSAQSQLIGKTVIQIFNITIKEITKAGLMVPEQPFKQVSLFCSDSN